MYVIQHRDRISRAVSSAETVPIYRFRPTKTVRGVHGMKRKKKEIIKPLVREKMSRTSAVGFYFFCFYFTFLLHFGLFQNQTQIPI